MTRFFDTLWHQRLHRPYRLACPLDMGTGTPVVLLHGIGVSHAVWRHVAELLAGKPFRVLAPDLLGFGASPKPDWMAYDVDDHARAVIACLQRRRVRQPVILAAHSMGCLVAVQVARLRPDLVRHLILYEMPLYAGLPESRRYTLRRDLYFKLYQLIINSPQLTASGKRNLRKTIAKMAGLKIPPELWVSFTRSLEHTIMQQTTLQDLKQLTLPIDIIYGSLDMLVIRGRPHHVFGADAAHITTHTIRHKHAISSRSSTFLVERIMAAAGLPASESTGPSRKLQKRASKP